MITFFLIIHLVVCIFLIGIVLIQGGKGAQMGSAFGGGSSQTLFGGRGAATFLSKLTTIIAVVFMVTSLMLAVLSVRKQSITGSSVIDQRTTTESPVPLVPEDVSEKAGVKPKKPALPQQTPPQ